MIGLLTITLRCLRLRSCPSFFMVNVFDPISVKLLITERLIPSVAVKIPINAMMPKIIMSKVSAERSLLARIALKANRIFSLRFIYHKGIRKVQIYIRVPVSLV